MKYIPNILSISRLVLTFLLAALTIALGREAFVFSTAFIIIYVAAGLTDAIDGPLARRLGVVSRLGSNLDSIGDFALGGITLILIIPVMNFNLLSILIVVSVFVTKALAVLVSFIKYKQALSLHTIISKFGAWVAFAFPLLYWLVKYAFPHLYDSGITENVLAIFLGGFIWLIMFEELMIHLVSKTPKPDAKGFLFDRKKRGD